MVMICCDCMVFVHGRARSGGWRYFVLHMVCGLCVITPLISVCSLGVPLLLDGGWEGIHLHVSRRSRSRRGRGRNEKVE